VLLALTLWANPQGLRVSQPVFFVRRGYLYALRACGVRKKCLAEGAKEDEKVGGISNLKFQI
jgi:hypothetical protein